jgi:hypothetical protein
MDAALERAQERNFLGVRPVQAAFHNRSLSLYTTLGFDAREPLSVLQGPGLRKPIEGCTARPAWISDLEICNRVCDQVHGHDRGRGLEDTIAGASAVLRRRSI